MGVLTCEPPSQDQMRRIPRLPILRNIPKAKLVEPMPSWDIGVDGVNGEENEPRKDPDGEQHFCNHAQEANVKVGIEPVHFFDLLVVGFEESEWP